MTVQQAIRIPETFRRQYHQEGYFILENAISHDDLAVLRAESDRLVALEEDRMEHGSGNGKAIQQRGRRYFIANRYKESGVLNPFLFGELMAAICRATLGNEAYLFHEQHVVKAAEIGTTFSWHQDSGYVGFPHKPYLTCWCALDDMSEANGTAYILPYSRSGHPELIEHRRSEANNDLVGYDGDDPGIPVEAPAGSVAVFSSLTLHRSGANTTNKPRRVYLPQYAAEPIRHPETGQIKNLADPFLKDGRIVAR